MARKRKTPLPTESGGQDVVQQARSELNASIEAKDAQSVVRKLTTLQHALITAKVPDADAYQELDSVAARSVDAIDDPAVKGALSSIKGGYAAVLSVAQQGDSAHQARTALAEAISRKDAQDIIRCLGELQEALLATKKPMADVYRELDRLAGEAIKAIGNDNPQVGTVRSMKASYSAVHSLSEQVQTIQAGPTQTGQLPPMTSPKGGKEEKA